MFNLVMRSLATFTNNQCVVPQLVVWNPFCNEQERKKNQHSIDLKEVFKASHCFSQTDIVRQTTLMHSPNLSTQYQANILIKREDQQRGRTYKVRGAYYNYLVSSEQRKKVGYVIVSDGNFAASSAIIAGTFKFKCTIFVPETCHRHKLEAIKRQGKQFVEIRQIGTDFQECIQQANKYSEQHNMPILKSYETLNLLIGFSTIAKEIIQADKKMQIDYVLIPAGGGALASSMASVIKQISPNTKVIAVQPDNCKPFSTSILDQKLVTFEKVSKFCNGSSITHISQVAYDLGKNNIDGFVEVTQRKLAQKIIQLYSMGIICEPSGALSICALDKLRDEIKGKNVVCLLSGANIDLTKLDEAREIAAISKGIKNHYHITLSNRKGVLHELIIKCFKPTDLFSIQYSQKVGKESSQVLLSVESMKEEDVQEYISKMLESKIKFENINDKQDLLDIFF